MKSSKCGRAREQYFANICLKYVSALYRASSVLKVSQGQCEAGWYQLDTRTPLCHIPHRPEEPDDRHGVRRAPFWCLRCRGNVPSYSADVMHPPPGAQDRPSFAALVANVDSDTSKYIADLRVQTGRREMIHDLESMAQVSTYRGFLDVV